MVGLGSFNCALIAVAVSGVDDSATISRIRKARRAAEDLSNFVLSSFTFILRRASSNLLWQDRLPRHLTARNESCSAVKNCPAETNVALHVVRFL